MNYLIGLDIGTSGVKGLLITDKGKIVTSHSSSYPLSTPHSGWAEQEPEHWWQATIEVIGNLVENGGIDVEKIRGLSLSGQMHSSVFLDREMEVIRPAILWSDTRTSEQCQLINNLLGSQENLIARVSNPALEGFTAPKILWLKEKEPGNYSRLATLLLPKDYIRYKLTGEVYMDVSDAAGTLLYDVKKGQWSQEVVKQLGLRKEILPEVVDSIEIAGQVSPGVAAETGLPVGLPVAAGGADNACGAVGSGIIETGKVMISIGSSGVVLAHSDIPRPDEQGRIHLFNHARPNSWYMMGVMLSAGMSFSWLQEKMYGDRLDLAELNQLAEDVPPASDGLLFLPYLYGERTPHADARARGVFFGISGKHQQGHFVRSVMEGVSFGLRDSLELIKEKEIEIDQVRAIGGGMKSQLWQQILADITGEEITLLEVEEGPAFGAALIAGVGAGVYEDFSQVAADVITAGKKISPIPENSQLYDQYYSLYRQLYNSLKDDFTTLSRLQK